MSANQNQHYLTQSYQRGWIDTSGRLHVYRWAYNELVCEPKATKSTGGRTGLYFIPMAPPGEQNMMEEVFWKRIDQWGADGLALLRTNDPAAVARINKDRLATFVMSFLFRNPPMVKYFNAWAKERVLNGCLKVAFLESALVSLELRLPKRGGVRALTFRPLAPCCFRLWFRSNPREAAKQGAHLFRRGRRGHPVVTGDQVRD